MKFPSWTEYGTAEELEKKLGFKIKLGWTETEFETTFCESDSHFFSEYDHTYYVYHWHEANVRAHFANMLAQPVESK